jgi:putative phosphoribosyl transferase
MLEAVTRSEQQELARREQRYRGDRPAPEMAGRCVVLVDDGVATGATIKAAIAGLRQRQPGKIVVAIPTAPPDVCAELETLADAVVCLAQPEPYIAVGRWYADFSQVSDAEVRGLLDRASAPPNAGD